MEDLHVTAPTRTVAVLREFRTFLLRGNIVDLAVGVIAGLVFNDLVNSLVNDIIMQLVAVVIGEHNFSTLHAVVNGAEIRYGAFLTAVLNFLLTMAAVFFLVVKPINAMTARLVEPSTEDAAAAAQRECPECLAEVPGAARRCRYCTCELVPTGS